MVLREGVLLVAGGLSVGVIVALGMTRLLSARLFGVRATDPATLVGATVVMTTVGVLAGLLPARRAARADPMVALRSE
jgi:putative ABC transport system permease protein